MIISSIPMETALEQMILHSNPSVRWNSWDPPEQALDELSSKTEATCTRITCTEQDIIQYLLPVVKGFSHFRRIAVVAVLSKDTPINLLPFLSKVANPCSFFAILDTDKPGDESEFYVGYYTTEYSKKLEFLPL